MTQEIKVAAIQMICKPLDRDDNLSRATQSIKNAAEAGAQLVLLPELMPSGYVLTEEIWKTAEPTDGHIVQWLQSTARQYNIYLGTSYVEVSGEDFYNCFVLCLPDGEIAGRIRKTPPAAIEAYFFQYGDGKNYIDTPLGRIGVGICYENLLFSKISALHKADVDLIIQPLAAGTPQKSFPIRKKDIDTYNQMVKNIPAYYAKTLGVPIITANQCGPLVTEVPKSYPRLDSTFPGFSAVFDASGNCLQQLGADEGIAMASITLDPTKKVKQAPKAFGYWSFPVPWFSFVFRVAEARGKRSYRRNKKRKLLANRISC